MGESNRYLTFTLDGRRYALPLRAAERAVRAAEPTPLPDAPDVILGVIDVQGEVVPVLNVRKRFGAPEREIEVADQFLLADTGARRVALWVDAAEEVVELSEEELTPIQEIAPGAAYVEQVGRDGDGLILVHDLAGFLSLEEDAALNAALEERRERGESC